MTDPGRGDRTGRNASSLAAAITALGLHCALEARGGLALLTPAPESVAMLQQPETRRTVLALAREHGFTHVAIELPNERGDQDAGERDASLLRD